MNARELIHALSAEWVDLDTEVTLYAWDADGRYVDHTVTEVTTTAADGVHRTLLDIEVIAG